MNDSVPMVNGVHIGKGGHLFLASGAHAVFEYATGRKTVELQSLVNFKNNISSRRNCADAFGCSYRHIIVPDKQSVLNDLVNGAEVSTRLGEQHKTFTGFPEILYPLRELQGLGETVFMRTDTHLADIANILLSRLIFTELTGEELSDEVDNLQEYLIVRKRHIGDLGSKLTPQIGAEELFLKREWGKLYSNHLSGNDGLIDVYVNPEAIREGRLVIFGDSFARAMGSCLSRLFSEVMFFRTRFAHGEIISLSRPDYLLTQNAERYLANVSADADAPPFFLYPNIIEAKKNNNKYPDLSEMLGKMLSGVPLPGASKLVRKEKELDPATLRRIAVALFRAQLRTGEELHSQERRQEIWLAEKDHYIEHARWICHNLAREGFHISEFI
ncbi:hypothetical protein LL251_20450 [Sphingobium naphthae]|nr:hypothetical protein [Sphingobium naphthae]